LKTLNPLRAISDWRSKRNETAKRKELAAKFRSTLEQRLTARREEWDADDQSLRDLMSAAAGTADSQAYRRLMRAMPSGSVKRGMESAPLRGRFDSALTTDDNANHWAMADGLAADAAANPGIRYILRNRARYEVHNNCYARGVGETIANDFVGTGPRLHIDDDRFPDDVLADIEAKWQAWSYAVDLAGKLRVMRKARRQDGETFALKITNPKLNHPVKLDLKVVEADRVRFVDIQLLLVPSVDGIRYDDYGNPLTYHVLRVHPGFWSYATGYVGFPWEYDAWDAKSVIHWFRKDRPEQHRGLPEILPALPLYATLRRFTQATLDAAETAADFAVLIQTTAGADDAETFAPFVDSVPLARRMITALPEGYQASQMKPEHPATTYPMFKREIIAEIGRCENVPYNVIAADSSESNFASGQLDHKIYFRNREIERAEAKTLILDNLFNDWLAEATLISDRGQSFIPQDIKSAGTIAHSWHWDSNELGDPLKLAAAKSTALKAGLTTIPAEYAARGVDWVKAFASAARSLGVSVEEYQELIRNSTFASAGSEPVDQTGDGRDGEPTKKQPGKAATSKAVA